MTLILSRTDQVGSNGEGLIDVLPVERGPPLPAIQCFIGGHPYTQAPLKSKVHSRSMSSNVWIVCSVSCRMERRAEME